MTDEDRYEAVEFIAKSRPDGESWFNIIIDYVSGDCTGGGGECIVEDGDDSDCDDHEHEEILPCSCGMESGGGMSGTLQQCYDWKTSVGSKLQPIHLARAIIHMHTKLSDAGIGVSEDTHDIVKWAEKEVEFEEYFENKEWEKEEE